MYDWLINLPQSEMVFSKSCFQRCHVPYINPCFIMHFELHIIAIQKLRSTLVIQVSDKMHELGNAMCSSLILSLGGAILHHHRHIQFYTSKIFLRASIICDFWYNMENFEGSSSVTSKVTAFFSMIPTTIFVNPGLCLFK